MRWPAAAVALAVLAGFAMEWHRTGDLAGAERRDRAATDRQLAAETASVNALARRVSDLQARLDSQPDLATVAKRVQPSVFSIETSDGVGSGFVIGSTGQSAQVVTDYHVVKADWEAGRRQVKVRQEGSPDRTGTVEKVSDASDLAMVQVDGNLPALGKGERPSVGDPVLVVGSPLGLGNSVSSGIVSAFREGFIQFSAPISPGNSGGPVLDREGRVVGVARSKLVGAGAEGLSFAIPIALVCSTVATC